MKKNLLFYTVMLMIFSSGIYLVMVFGSRLESKQQVGDQGVSLSIVASNSKWQEEMVSALGDAGKYLYQNLREPLTILLLQVIVILIATRLTGSIFAKFGQPAVVGEIIAGILLGPSLFGMVFPAGWSFLFQGPSMEILKLLGQIGVIMFMFVVGMELNTDHLRRKAHAAVIISHASIVVPFFLGVLLTLFIYRSFAPSSASFTSFALFMAVAMSITAFPVLARIIEDRGMSGSSLGSAAIACAAVDDVTAWCVLALVVATVRTSGMSVAMTFLLALAFIVVMLYLIRPCLERLLGTASEDGREVLRMIGVLVFIFASACYTEVIGIHALFGAFLAGVVMPAASDFRETVKKRLTSFSSYVLLPLFFAFTGLRTQIGLLDNWEGWLAFAGVIAVAIVGKLGGSMLAARWTGMSWSDSFVIGALMNTRGLMELIVLNIGYDLGIIQNRVFAIMVLMAVVTTSMTGPLLTVIDLMRQRRSVFIYETYPHRS